MIEGLLMIVEPRFKRICRHYNLSFSFISIIHFHLGCIKYVVMIFVVYAAEVKSNNGNETKRYIGMTANPFKSRFNNQKKSFNHIKYEKETELLKYIWDLKRKNKDFTIKWPIMKRAPAYTSGYKCCNLCIE